MNEDHRSKPFQPGFWSVGDGICRLRCHRCRAVLATTECRSPNTFSRCRIGSSPDGRTRAGIPENAVHRSRPDIGRRTTAAGWSFPSGHSATAAGGWAAIALALLSRSSRRWRKSGAFAALVVTVAVACSRVLLGVHWMTDVIAGITVGWSWFLVVTVIFGGRLFGFGEPAERVSEVNHSRTVREPCG